MVLPKLILHKERQPRPSDIDGAGRDEEINAPKSPSSPAATLAPYPSKQLLVLACCRFSEPVAMTSSFPYLFFMIRDFHLTDDEKKIGRYTGLLASSFSFAQVFSGWRNHIHCVHM
jgi:hypothetical protein